MISAARAFLSHRPALVSLGFAAREHHDDDETDGDDDNENDGANRDADPEPDARRRRRLWRFGLCILGFFQRYVERGRWWIIVDGWHAGHPTHAAHAGNRGWHTTDAPLRWHSANAAGHRRRSAADSTHAAHAA